MTIWKPIAIASIIGLVASVGVNVAAANQCYNHPHMANALSSLRAARAALDQAEHNKGGWRAAAIEHANRAIHETERGCAFANK